MRDEDRSGEWQSLQFGMFERKEPSESNVWIKEQPLCGDSFLLVKWQDEKINWRGYLYYG
jgi:hypothetical protein